MKNVSVDEQDQAAHCGVASPADQDETRKLVYEWLHKFIPQLSGRRLATLKKFVDLATTLETREEKRKVAEAIADCLCREDASIKEVAELLQKEDSDAEKLAKHRKHVADNVSRLRVERGWTQTQLAKKAGLPQPHVSRIETCSLAPTKLTLSKLAKALGVRLVDLDLGFESGH